MSNHEHENGELLIPTAAFSKLRRTVCEGYNAWQEHSFAVAQKVHEQVSAAIKGKRLPDVENLVSTTLDKLHQQQSAAPHIMMGISRSSSVRPYTPRLDEEAVYAIREQLLKTDPTTRRVSLRRPLKKDFPTVPLTYGEFQVGEVGLRFDATARRVYWNVSENNHAVDRAWEGVLGQVLAHGLSQVTWTRGTGGTFLYNNEYNRDSGRDYEGGGGMMVSRRFGPLGEDPMLKKLTRSTPARKPTPRR